MRLGQGRIVVYNVSAEALEELLQSGGVWRPIPAGPSSPRFKGYELFVPTSVFPVFNELLANGEIHVHG